MDEKDSARKQARSCQKKPSKMLFCAFPQRTPGEEDRKQERQVTEIDHVDVCVHFGPAVFKERPDFLKTCVDLRSISSKCRVRGGCQAGADTRRILVQNENRENISEKHSNEDQSNPSEHEQSSGTQRSKRNFAHFVRLFRRRGIDKRPLSFFATTSGLSRQRIASCAARLLPANQDKSPRN